MCDNFKMVFHKMVHNLMYFFSVFVFNAQKPAIIETKTQSLVYWYCLLFEKTIYTVYTLNIQYLIIKCNLTIALLAAFSESTLNKNSALPSGFFMNCDFVTWF